MPFLSKHLSLLMLVGTLLCKTLDLDLYIVRYFGDERLHIG